MREGSRGLPLLHQRYPLARDRYSPVRVSTLMQSPSLRNKGTRTTAPVSNLAALLPPAAVSPRTPGSVSTIFSTTKLGGSTVSGSLFHKVTAQTSCSFSHFLASPMAILLMACCSKV